MLPWQHLPKMFQWFWMIIKWEHTKTNLILGVPEPQGSVDDHEEEGEDDSREKDEDAAELVKRNWIFFNLKKNKTEPGKPWRRWSRWWQPSPPLGGSSSGFSLEPVNGRRFKVKSLGRCKGYGWEDWETNIYLCLLVGYYKFLVKIKKIFCRSKIVVLVFGTWVCAQ